MKLRVAREASGKTQRQVAKEAGVTERTYLYYETNDMEPGVRTANRIARAVHSTTEKLWGFGAATPTIQQNDNNHIIPQPNSIVKVKIWK